MKPNRCSLIDWRAVLWMALPLWAAGCTSTFFADAPVQTADIVAAAEEEPADNDLVLVGDLTIPTGLHFVRIEAVGLMTGLSGTGSNPSPSAELNSLIGEMQTREVRNIEGILESPDTSMVLAEAYLPPGAQEGDRLDLFVRVDRRSETTSLRGGWLLKARLCEQAMIGGTIHEGHVLGLGEGAVLVDSLVEGGDDNTRGRVLGGLLVTQPRPFGLRLRSGHTSIRTSAAIGNAINRRFHDADGGLRKGTANPQTEQVIELAIHPRYQHNLARYIRVVQSIPLNETPQERAARIERLRVELCQPSTSATAALHLEALGVEGKQPLEEALKNPDPLVRFYAAEALAYMDEAAAADVLAEAVRREPAFRWHALTALAAMQDITARDALVKLLDETSAETRYGAFCSLLARDSHDPHLNRRVLGGCYYFHAISSSGPPMVHVSRSRRPEIVVFGDDLPLKTPMVLLVGGDVTVKSIGQDRLRVSRFSSSEEDDQQVECDATLQDLLMSLGRFEVTYEQTVQFLQQARTKGYLEARLVFDALPTPNRTYLGEQSSEPGGEISEEVAPELPLPSLFQTAPAETSRQEEPAADEESLPAGEMADQQAEESPEGPPRRRSLLGRITGSDS